MAFASTCTCGFDHSTSPTSKKSLLEKFAEFRMKVLLFLLCLFFAVSGHECEDDLHS